MYHIAEDAQLSLELFCAGDIVEDVVECFALPVLSLAFQLGKILLLVQHVLGANHSRLLAY